MDSKPILIPLKEVRECPSHLKRAMHSINAKPKLGVKIEHALALDCKQEFIKLLNSISRPRDVPNRTLLDMFMHDSAQCASAVLAGETDIRIFDLIAEIYDLGVTPLHMAAQYGANNLTALFIDNNGEEADVRIDGNGFKQVLPLNVALSMIRDGHPLYSFTNDSPFPLLLKLCSPAMRHLLETVRLLARRTKCIDEEVSYYFKEGTMDEFGALLMVNCMPPPTLLLRQHEYSQSSERARKLQLLDIFEKVGHKLRAYVRIRRPKSNWGQRTVDDLATIFQDADLPLKSEDTYPYVSNPLWKLHSVSEDEKALLGSEVQQAMSGSGYEFQGSGLRQQALHNGLDNKHPMHAARFNSERPINGVRAFHTSSSFLKTESFQCPSFVYQVRNLCSSKECKFFVTALRKGVRYL